MQTVAQTYRTTDVSELANILIIISILETLNTWFDRDKSFPSSQMKLVEKLKSITSSSVAVSDSELQLVAIR